MFENGVLRGISGHKRDEAAGEWRKLHSEELNGLYSSPNIIWVIKLRRMRLAGLVACVGEKRGVYRILAGKAEGKIPLRRTRPRWKESIKMDFQETECGAWSGSMWIRIETDGGLL